MTTYNFLTRADVDNYGSDLVDFAQRAAAHAIAPHLQNLNAENAELRQRLAVEARYRLDQQVEAAIPNYRDIDRDPRWHQWLMTRGQFTVVTAFPPHCRSIQTHLHARSDWSAL